MINIRHGGDLDQAAQEFGIEHNEWLDLSTGIAPWSWPIPDIPDVVWQRLPAVECPLRPVAADYYGCRAEVLLAIPGSQFAIQILPQLFPDNTRVAVPRLGYFEHRKAWQQAGHSLLEYNDQSLDQLDQQIAAGELDVVLAINPNNPTTTLLPRERLLHWRELLARRGGCLIVDEAFMDTYPGMSLATECPCPGLIVLRSLGKFFGLAGLRLGFVLAEAPVLELLAQRLGPWAVNGPAQYLGSRALADKVWQLQQKQRIELAMAEQMALLQDIDWGCSEEMREAKGKGKSAEQVRQGPLYCTVTLAAAGVERWYRKCGQQGILVRRFVQCECDGRLRFGLAKDQEQLARLATVLRATELQGSHSGG